MEAATKMSPASRPIQLYYGLTQGARAIAAAHAEQWSLHGHGLRIANVESDILVTKIEPTGEGEFQAIAALTCSATISAPVEIGALWASLPELVQTADEERWPVAAAVWPRYLERGVTLKLMRGLETVVNFSPMPQSVEDVRSLMESYPSAGDDWRIQQPVGALNMTPVTVATPIGIGVPVVWGDAETDIRQKLEDVAPEYRFRDEHWLRPGVGSNRDLLSPLMAWWALLFGVSILARYHPGEWVRALDPDKSKLAAPIGEALDEALTAVPHLLLEALYAEPIRLVPRRGW